MKGAPVYLHVGLMKTGTSYLQQVLRGAGAELEAQGVSLVPEHQVAAHRLSLAVRRRDLNGRRDHAGHDVLARLPGLVDAAPGRRCLLSEESLAFAEPAQLADLGRRLAGHEVHVVLTVRDVARTVPSAWQQRVRAGRPLGFADYLDAVVSGEGSAGRAFAVGHGAVHVLRRWATLAPGARTHVVVVPRAGARPGLLLERFCAALDVEADRLPQSGAGRAGAAGAGAAPRNESLGAPQAELLRRVNELLPPELRTRARHGALVKRYLAAQVLAPQGGRRTLLPDTHRAWALEHARATIEAIRAGGHDVHGDLDDLLPDPASFAPPQLAHDDGTTSRVGESELVDAAARAIVTLLLDRDETDRTHREGPA